MRDANIERLLGGYATNTLTEAERSALFEAALEDQELFNALQDEEVLRDVLQDPDSRASIKRVLDKPAPQPRNGWLTTGWAWGLGAGAAAAAALTFVALSPTVSRDQQVHVAVSQPPPPVLSPAAEAPTKKAVPESNKAVSRAPEPRRQVTRERAAIQMSATAPPALATAQPAAIHVAQQADAQAKLSEAVGSAAVQSTLRATSSAYVPGATLRQDMIRYSVLKRGADGSFNRLSPGDDIKAGDSVQLMISPAISGALLLQEEIPGGAWTTIFPAASAGLPVTENREVVIPDSPMLINGPRQLRLVLSQPQSPRPIITVLRLVPGPASPAK